MRDFPEKTCASGWLIPALFVLAGIMVRLFVFGAVPCGFNQDEAFAGYEAFSLLRYGVDSAGYSNPCYFVSWGSGMNVLESYLAMPFMAFLGCDVIALRLPQLIVASVSLIVFFLLLRKVFSWNVALMGLALLVMAPWHIMLSRWGLESNLAPGFLLFGFFFLVKGVDDDRWWLLSALFYGISLYAYAIAWIVVPLTILVCGAYIARHAARMRLGAVLGSGAILFLLATPLILFLLVNKGVIPEIRTPLLSVPKLVFMRGSEVSLGNLVSIDAWRRVFDVLVLQSDSLPWNSPGIFGLFYPVSIPFLLIGIVVAAKAAWRSFIDRSFSYEALFLMGFLTSLLVCLMISDLNINKANSLHFFTLMLVVVGIARFVGAFRKHGTLGWAMVLCSYGVAFALFIPYYFGPYNRELAPIFRDDVGAAIEFLKEKGEERECVVDSSVTYPQVLFFDETPQPLFASTVVYEDGNAAYRRVKSFGEYEFGIDFENLDPDKTYLLKTDDSEAFLAMGYQVTPFDAYSVAFR